MSQQNEFIPNYASPPGASLLEMLESLGMSQSDLSLRLGKTKKYVNELIKGKAPISPETAIYLERILMVPAEYWLNRETQYRESLARIEERTIFSKSDSWMKQFPLKEMLANKWIERKPSATDQLHALLEYFGIGSPDVWPEFWGRFKVNFRKSDKFECPEGALAAWLRRGEIDATPITCEPFSIPKFKNILTEIRGITNSNPEYLIPHLQSLCAQAGVAVVFTKEFPKLPVSGATRWLSPNKALIQLSLRYKTNDHLWFTFFHEAGHIILHGKKEIFLDGNPNNEEVREKEANDFSRNFLISPADYASFQKSWNKSSKEIVAFSTKIGIAPGIVVGRLQHDKVAAYHHHNDLKQKLIWSVQG